MDGRMRNTERTPDEIKKGLECCSSSLTHCAPVCPYLHKCFAGEVRPVLKDALTLIQQLQAKVEKLKAQIDNVPRKKRICTATGRECCECKPGGPCAKER